MILVFLLVTCLTVVCCDINVVDRVTIEPLEMSSLDIGFGKMKRLTYTVDVEERGGLVDVYMMARNDLDSCTSSSSCRVYTSYSFVGVNNVSIDRANVDLDSRENVFAIHNPSSFERRTVSYSFEAIEGDDYTNLWIWITAVVVAIAIVIICVACIIACATMCC